MTPSPYGRPSPHRGLSDRARFWIGVVLAVPALVVVGFLSALPSIVVDAAGLDAAGLTEAATALIDLVLLGLVIAAVVWERTRFLVLGMMAGVAILFVIAAGACVVLLSAYSGGV